MWLLQLIPDSKDWLDCLAAFGPIAAVIAIIINVLLTNRAIKKADLRQIRSDTYRQIANRIPAYQGAINALIRHHGEVSRKLTAPVREDDSGDVRSWGVRIEIVAKLARSYQILEQEEAGILLLVAATMESGVFGDDGVKRLQEIGNSIPAFHNTATGYTSRVQEAAGLSHDDWDPVVYFKKMKADIETFPKIATKHRDNVISGFLWLVGVDTFKSDYKKNPRFILREAELRPPGQNRESGSTENGKTNDPTE